MYPFSSARSLDAHVRRHAPAGRRLPVGERGGALAAAGAPTNTTTPFFVAADSLYPVDVADTSRGDGDWPLPDAQPRLSCSPPYLSPNRHPVDVTAVKNSRAVPL